MSSEERLIRKAIARFRCSHCNRQHLYERVTVMGRYDDVWIMGVDCDECEQPGMYVVTLFKDGSLETVSDLTEAERSRFRRLGSIQSGDVEEMRRFLGEFDGNFSRAFGKES